MLSTEAVHDQVTAAEAAAAVAVAVCLALVCSYSSLEKTRPTPAEHTSPRKRASILLEKRVIRIHTLWDAHRPLERVRFGRALQSQLATGKRLPKLRSGHAGVVETDGHGVVNR